MSSAARSRFAEEPQKPPEPVEEHADIYRAHFDFVWRNLRRLGVPPYQLEDAAQDVFLTAHRRFTSYDSSRSSLQSWLFGIALRVARGYRRTFRRRLAQLVSMSDDREAPVASASRGPAELAEQRQSLALLDRLLASIDEEKRAVLLLVDVEELSVTEAADVLGVNLNTLYWRLRVARRALQRALERARLAEQNPLRGVPR